jgi:hypothetical protein
MHDDHDWHEHGYSEEKPQAAPGHLYRCTYCNSIIPKPLTPANFGLPDDAVIEVGKQYPYTGCWCGWSKYVICES